MIELAFEEHAKQHGYYTHTYEDSIGLFTSDSGNLDHKFGHYVFNDTYLTLYNFVRISNTNPRTMIQLSDPEMFSKIEQHIITYKNLILCR